MEMNHSPVILADDLLYCNEEMESLAQIDQRYSVDINGLFVGDYTEVPKEDHSVKYGIIDGDLVYGKR